MNHRNAAQGAAQPDDRDISQAWVETDAYGLVTAASPRGARLFNLTVRGLVGRNLPLFFDSRHLVLARLEFLRRRPLDTVLLELDYRPLECRTRRIRITLHAGDGANGAVRWSMSELPTQLRTQRVASLPEPA